MPAPALARDLDEGGHSLTRSPTAPSTCALSVDHLAEAFSQSPTAFGHNVDHRIRSPFTGSVLGNAQSGISDRATDEARSRAIDQRQDQMLFVDRPSLQTAARYLADILRCPYLNHAAVRLTGRTYNRAT